MKQEKEQERCQECNTKMEWVQTGTHVFADETIAEEGFWRCPKCGATC